MYPNAIHETGTGEQSNIVRARNGAPTRSAAFRFGDFKVIPASRMLVRNNAPVDLGGRAFDLLITLMQSHGEIVTNDRIMREVWPTTKVDVSNIRYQMSCLRRALGEERNRIKTLAGRGYRFIADDTDIEKIAEGPAGSPAPGGRSPIVIISGSIESRELLYRALASAEVRVAGTASAAKFPAATSA